MRIGFIGLGNMGTTMANLLAGNGHDVIGWEQDRGVVEEINAAHVNTRYLGGISLNSRLAATSRIAEVLDDRAMVFIALPSLFIRSVLEPLKGRLNGDAILVNLAKGIEADTGLTSFQVLSLMFPGSPRVMLSGPSIANEIAQGWPTVAVIAGTARPALEQVSVALDNEFFKTSISNDAVGVELGGILKNIYAIGLGIFDGKNIRSINFRSVYLTLALAEMKSIGVQLGAKPETFYFFSGLGDLFATSLSEHSHNRRLGEYLAQGLSIDEIRTKMKVLPEGYNTLRVLLAMAKQRSIDTPVACGLNEVVSGRMSTDDFIHSVIRGERMYYERHIGY